MPPGAAEAPDDAVTMTMTDTDGPRGPDVHAVLESLRRDFERAFAGELTRVERSFGSYVAELQRKLTDAESQLAALAAERTRLAAEHAAHERKWKAVRDIAGNAGR